MTRLQCLNIDLQHINDPQQLQRLLRDALNFPDSYGCNWDAFWDAISGLVELPRQLRLQGWAAFAQRLPDQALQLERSLERLRRDYPEWATQLSFE
ncbi:barstar family protein [Pseudomonas sp. NFXW11]|uniref:barstar family protein n=1 Tax=Pseudomonas sp. NFXW11 TaxID=2819531 RepID=UPI003CFB181C